MIYKLKFTKSEDTILIHALDWRDCIAAMMVQKDALTTQMSQSNEGTDTITFLWY
jgi:hypothetical protein